MKKHLLLLIVAVFCLAQGLTAQTVHLTTPGTLEEKMTGATDVKSLTITGALGGADISYIRQNY